MTEVTRVTLGGIPLSIRPSESIAWSLRAGVNPVQRTFVVTRARALRILRRAQTQFRSLGVAGATRTRRQADNVGPLTFRVTAPGYKPLVVRNLYAIEASAADENRLGVVVSDRRWLWKREHVLRDYNLRRFSGNFSLVGNALTPIQVKDTQPDFIFRRVTLNNGVPWTAKEVLKDILTQLVGPGQFRIGRLTLFKDIHDLTVDESGTSALARVLAYLPGAQIYIDVDGKVVVYDSLGGEEDGMLAIAGKPFPGNRQVELIDRSLIRPKNVISLFEIEPEIRFDYVEQGGATTRAPLREPRVLENVLPVTDPTLTVNGKLVARNTWLPIDTWLSAVAAKGDFPGGPSGRSTTKALGPLSQALIRKHYLSGFVHLRNKYVLAELGLPDPLMQLRIDAIAQYWRGAFRLLPQWRDKVKAIRAIRASIVDQENGTRGKAEAFFDYTSRPSRRTLAKTAKGEEAAWSILGLVGVDITGAQPGPADVVILEKESGLFQLVYRVDPWGDNVKYAPGRLLAAVPVQSAGDAFLAWNSTKVELAPSWRMSVILTVTLAAPNNQTRLHPHSVPIAKALRLLPGGRKSKTAKGPDWKIRVGPGIQTARFAWIDSFASKIEEAVFTNKQFPSELLVNRSHIKAIAEANAARIQALLMDRHQGEQVVSLNPDVKPAGSLAQVTHIVMIDSVTTHMSLPAIATPPDLLALLPDSTRKLIQRGVEE